MTPVIRTVLESDRSDSEVREMLHVLGYLPDEDQVRRIENIRKAASELVRQARYEHNYVRRVLDTAASDIYGYLATDGIYATAAAVVQLVAEELKEEVDGFTVMHYLQSVM